MKRESTTRYFLEAEGWLSLISVDNDEQAVVYSDANNATVVRIDTTVTTRRFKPRSER